MFVLTFFLIPILIGTLIGLKLRRKAAMIISLVPGVLGSVPLVMAFMVHPQAAFIFFLPGLFLVLITFFIWMALFLEWAWKKYRR